jgi:hypothetical protein
MVEGLLGGFDRLRHEPIGKRVRALVYGALVVDSVRAMLVRTSPASWRSLTSTPT